MTTRSPAIIDLLGLLGDSAEADVTLAVDVVDGPCAPMSFAVPRARAVHALNELGRFIEHTGASLSCVTGVARVEVRVQVDGDTVIHTGFPLKTLPRIAPALDSFLELLGAFGDHDAAFARSHFATCAPFVREQSIS